jgi:RecB family endonuclease NucS
MGLYTLKVPDKKNLSSGILEKAKTDTVKYEKSFEDWLENSPNVLLDEDEGSIIWIGRQVPASVGDAGFYPDLIGIDTTGNLVIVELKKVRRPVKSLLRS